MDEDTKFTIGLLTSIAVIVFIIVLASGAFATDRKAYVIELPYQGDAGVKYDKWKVSIDRRLGEDRHILTTQDYDYAVAVCDSINESFKEN